MSHRPLTPILLKSIAIHLPFLSRYFCKSMPSAWQKVVNTPPTCITVRLPFVSRCFVRSIRVRGHWSTPNFWDCSTEGSEQVGMKLSTLIVPPHLAAPLSAAHMPSRSTAIDAIQFCREGHVHIAIRVGWRHFYFSTDPPPLLRGRRLSTSWRGSVLSRFSVGFWVSSSHF